MVKGAMNHVYMIFKVQMKTLFLALFNLSDFGYFLRLIACKNKKTVKVNSEKCSLLSDFKN